MARVAIIGGGISGLATAFAIQEKAKKLSKSVELAIFEKENRLGGTIKSERIQGYLCESGPTGFLDNKPDTPKLVGDLGLKNKLLPSNDAARKRYLYIDGRLQQVPESPPAFLSSKILSLRGKLRIVGEVRSKKPPLGADESIFEFASRHIGKEAAEKLIDAVTTGIFAGDARKLSVKSCFPVMIELEKEGSGSLVRAMFGRVRAKRKQKKEAGETGASEVSTGSEMGGGNLTSFDEGMETLVAGLKESIKGNFYLSKACNGFEKGDGKYAFSAEGAEKPFEADIVVLAIPSYAAAELLESFDEEMAKALKEIPYAPINVVNFGYPRQSVTHSLEGFGFLIPSREKREILGTIWTTSVFGGMAPQNHVALKTMIGGAQNPEAAALDDRATIELVRKELRKIMGISADPTFIKIYRYEKGIPQYVIGHGERLGVLEKRLTEHPGLFLTGNAYLGIGLNDCTRNAHLVSDKITEYLKTSQA